MKQCVLLLSLLYLTIYIPIALATYLPRWYELNCNWHTRCDRIGTEAAHRAAGELTGYFLRRGELVMDLWTEKEKNHLEEVRGILDKMFLAALIAALGAWTMWNGGQASRLAAANGFFILALAGILPFFGFFWREVFHPLVFDNDLWKNTPSEVSYYIMPRKFFLHTAIFVIFSSAAANFILWLSLRDLGGNSSRSK
ncbi:MAG: lipoprotein intramolecular transacylase Lit [Deltaproteobacteria bacterium]